MMRTTLFAALASACLLVQPAAGQAQQTPDTRPGIAVLPFDNGGSYGSASENFELLGVGLQASLTYELGANTNLRVVDRAVLRQVMAEQDLGASGRVDAQTAARIGRIVGARYVVAGSFIDLFGDFTMTGRIIDVETTEILRTAQARGPREQVYGLIVRLAGDMTNGVRLPALPSAVRDGRSARPITPEAMIRHAMILSYRDEGDTERAIELYRQLVADFPQVEEYQTELRQLTAG
jgi:TolB-like protein